jgi:geranylgeranyl diphosphate synthase type II
MHSVSYYQEKMSDHFSQIVAHKEPKNLYEPIQYILSLGGKRMRPVLTLMASEVFNTPCDKALPAATAIEVFHNFSLIHDDIMDDAPLRRGHQTVHEKWDLNTGILSGDAMLILAYQFFESYPPETFQKLAKLFSKTALEVCEGQQYDVDFELRNDVTIPEYLKMIEYKTAVLVGAAMKMGAIVAETSDENANLIYDFGLNLGLAFQLQDDYLDAFGEVAKLGKQKGGDIQANKKTYLLLKAMELANEEQKNQIEALLQSTAEDKVAQMLSLFEATKAKDACKTLMQQYTQAAFDSLESLSIAPHKKEPFIQVTNYLLNREH